MQTPKGHHSNHWSPPGYRAIDYNFSGAAIQTISYPEWSNHQIHVSLPFQKKGYCVGQYEMLCTSQVDDISCPSLIQCHNYTVEGHQICQAWFIPLVKSCWLSPVNSLFSLCLSIVLRTICSMLLPGTELRRTGLYFPFLFLFPPLFKNGGYVSPVPVRGIFIGLPHLLKYNHGLATTSTSSLGTPGCISSPESYW